MKTWKVSGHWQHNGVAATTDVRAATRKEATDKAAAMGMMVSTVLDADPMVASYAGAPEKRAALGLTSRGQAWAVAIVGLCLAPVIIGLPLLIWGILADIQINSIDKRNRAAGFRA